MVVYNFKKIQPVPTNKDFVDIILSKTQRKTPTVVHAGYQITRIRDFYMRKVRFTQQSFHEKMSYIVDDFPKLDDIHPFYADLINVLYDRDHYKLALGQINIARHLIDNIAKDYCRMLKYGDSLFRCKQLKRAALGRMCTVMRKQGPTLQYLEEVRKHLARLPSIDPTSRTLLICGFPNVGKSSFMNKVTRADVEVQPYAFTTKSLFVGHMDYKYHRWQVIDTPGILDHPLEERNPIEMQSVTALAHLQCAIMFFLDISGHCGYTIEQQLSLFKNVSPLFVNKPVVLVITKIDVQPWETLEPGYKKMIEDAVTKQSAIMTTMSNFTEEGVMEAKHVACEALREKRMETKMKNNKKVGDVLNRLSVMEPKPRDGRARDATIPASVLAARAAKSAFAGLLEAPSGSMPTSVFRTTAPSHKRKLADGEDDDDAMDEEDITYGAVGSHELVRKWLERDREEEGGGPGVHRTDTTRYYQLRLDDWKSDLIPEIMDGKNIADFIDPDIEERLLALEAEEEALIAAEGEEGAIIPEDDPEQKALLRAVRDKKKLVVLGSRRDHGKNRPSLPRTTPGVRPSKDEAKAHFEAIGLGASVDRVLRHATGEDETAGKRRGRSESRGRKATAAEDDGDVAMAGAGSGAESSHVKRGRSRSLKVRSRHDDEDEDMGSPRPRSRSRSRTGAPPEVAPKQEGLKDEKQKFQLRKLLKKIQKKEFNGTQGETDRRILAKRPKHLFSGKRGIGSSDWR